MQKLILASQSVYRKRLLGRLGFSFQAQKPQVDEEQLKQMHASLPPDQLCVRLAIEKAQSLSGPNLVVIGSDQMVVSQGQIFGKPGTAEMAFLQIQKLQSKTHELLTSVAVTQDQKIFTHLNRCKMHMRKLSDREILKMIEIDQPLDCAGSYKIESLGISLFDKIDCEDWTAIEGLPLLWLRGQLEACGGSFA